MESKKHTDAKKKEQEIKNLIEQREEITRRETNM